MISWFRDIHLSWKGLCTFKHFSMPQRVEINREESKPGTKVENNYNNNCKGIINGCK